MYSPLLVIPAVRGAVRARAARQLGTHYSYLFGKPMTPFEIIGKLIRDIYKNTCYPAVGEPPAFCGESSGPSDDIGAKRVRNVYGVKSSPAHPPGALIIGVNPHIRNTLIEDDLMGTIDVDEDELARHIVGAIHVRKQLNPQDCGVCSGLIENHWEQVKVDARANGLGAVLDR